MTDEKVLDPATWTSECAAQHFGAWLVNPDWFARAVAAVKDGTYQIKKLEVSSEPEKEIARRPYVNHDGVAIIPIQGVIMKAASKFGGTSSVETRSAIRKAVNDDSVQSILLHIDSPGGAVAGTFELAKDIARFNLSKPIYAHIEDLGASAAYLLASQTRRITADSTSYIGSIGVVTTLVDSTGAMEKAGIKVEVISTGGMKGAGRDGKVTDEMREEAQKIINEIGDHFVAAVAAGRGMKQAEARKHSDGRVHIASEAKNAGLIDEVVSLDAAFAYIQKQQSSSSVLLKDGMVERVESLSVSMAVLLGNKMTDSQPALEIETVQNVITAPEPAPSGATLPVSQTQEPIMAEVQNPPAQNPAAPTGNVQQGITPQSTIQQLNQTAINGFTEQGRKAGEDQGRKAEIERMRVIAEQCPEKPGLAIAAFLAGQSPEMVKYSYGEAIKADAKLREVEEEKAKEIARLNALMATGGYPGGLSINVSGNVEDVPQIDPKLQAEQEWDRKPGVRNGFSSKENYVNFRVSELNGQFQGYLNPPQHA